MFAPFFMQLFPSFVSLGLFILGCYLVTVAFIAREGWRNMKFSMPLFLWMLVGCFAVGSAYWNSSFNGWVSFAVLGCAVMGVLLTAFPSWPAAALRVVLSYSLVHVCATLFFFMVPSAYDALIAPRFFTQSAGATGYASALTAHYSYNAFFGVLCLLAALSYVFATKNMRVRWVYILVCVSAFSAVLLTGKRAHLVFGLIAVLSIVAVSNIRGRVAKLTGLLLLAVGGAFVLARFVPAAADSLDRLLGTFESSDVADATSGRTFLWRFAYEGWKEEPLLGHGWGSYLFVWPGGSVSVHAHNAFMHLLYEVGVIGLVLILAAVISAFWSAAVSVRRARATASYPLSDSLYFAFAVQVFMIVYAFTSGELVSNIYIAIPYLMCVAIVAARSGTVTELWKEAPESPSASHERAGRSHVTSTVAV